MPPSQYQPFGADAVAVDPVIADHRVLADLVEDPLRPVVLHQVVLDQRAAGIHVGPQSPAVVVVGVDIADGDLANIPLHATGLVFAAGVQGVVTGQLGPVEGGRVPIQAVEEHSGGCVAADP